MKKKSHFNEKKEPKSPDDHTSRNFVYGRNTVLSYLEKEKNQANSTINKVFVYSNAASDPRLLKIRNLARQLKITTKNVSREKIESMLKSEKNPNHQGVVASLSPVELKSFNDLEEIIEEEKAKGSSMNGYTIVVVDGVEDPRNLGAIIRTAESTGAKAVIVPERRASSVTDIVAKTSAGAIAHIPVVRVTNIASTIDKLKDLGFWSLGMAPEAKEELFDLDLICPIALIVGSEGKGMARLVKEKCDFLGSIPTLGKTESLNVSVALGIGLYEIVRQNRKST